MSRDAQVKQVLFQVEQEFADKITQIREKTRLAHLTQIDQEVYEVNQKYNVLQKNVLDAIDSTYKQEILSADGNKDKIILAEQNKADAIKRIQQDLADANALRQEEIDNVTKAGAIKFEEDLNSLKLKSDIDLANDKEKIQLEINRKYKKLLDENLADATKIAEIKAQMEDEFRQRTNDLETDKYKILASKIKEWTDFALTQLTNVTSAWFDYQNAILQKEEAANTEKKNSLQKQLDSKLITQAQYNTAVAKLDSEADKKKRQITHDQAVVAKATNVVNAIINTAVAVTSVLSIPLIGMLLAVVVAALGAAQIALILATPVPAAAKGRYNVIGQDDKKLYSDVPYEESYTGITGRPMLVNETGNEIVIDPETTKRLQRDSPEIIDAINQARQPARESRILLPVQNNNMRFGNDIFDMIMRVPQRQAGAFPVQEVKSEASQIIVNTDNSELKASIDQLNVHLSKGIRSFISYDHMTEEMKKVSDIQYNVSR